MKKIYVVLFITLVGFQVKAQVIAWDFSGKTGSETFVSPTYCDPNLTASQISRGSVTATALTHTYAATNWTLTNSLADAISNNSYFQFSMHSNSGYLLSFSELDANFKRTSTGPTAFQWKYSIDGTNFTNIGSQISYTGTENNGVIQPSINLNPVPQLQDVNNGITVTFRLYGFNAADAAGSFGLGRLHGDDLFFLGKVYPSGVLPIKLVSFSVVNNGNDTRLHWLVDCTSTSARFEMQRAGSDMHYYTIYSSTETQTRCAQPFDINDANTAEGINFYRLKMIDIDGKAAYSKTLQVINKNTANTTIKIFPTLVKDNATISIQSGGNYKAEIIFIDNRGCQVNKLETTLQKGINNVPINTMNFPAGKYYIKVISGEEKNNPVVMIKQ